MRAGASGERGQPTGRGESRIRHDPSGEITRRLSELIERGSAITTGLQELACEHAINAPAKTIEQWRLACLRTLHAAFTHETALEFLRASERSTRPAGQHPSGDPELEHMRDALALLQELKRTLEPRGRARTHTNDAEPGGFSSSAWPRPQSERLAPQGH